LFIVGWVIIIFAIAMCLEHPPLSVLAHFVLGLNWVGDPIPEKFPRSRNSFATEL
jgi:hypothetical protein